MEIQKVSETEFKTVETLESTHTLDSLDEKRRVAQETLLKLEQEKINVENSITYYTNLITAIDKTVDDATKLGVVREVVEEVKEVSEEIAEK